MSGASRPPTSENLTSRVDAANSTEKADEEGAMPSQQPPRPEQYSIYTTWEKRLIVLCASLAGFFSPFTAQIYLPALPALAQDFQVSSSDINLTLTTYMIFQGIVPMFIGSLADYGGRRLAYFICFTIYTLANIGLALSQNYASLLIIRCIQSAGSSSTIALASAVVSDVITSAERGQYISITILPSVLAPALGPFIGGALTEYLGWRWIFWFLAIFSGVYFSLLLLFFPETCRRIVGDGSNQPPRLYQSAYQLLRKSSTVTSTASKPTLTPMPKPTPFSSLYLLFKKELGLLLSFSAIGFAGLYALTASLPTQLKDIYGLNSLKVGLMYLPLAGGSITSALIVGPLTDWNYRRHCRRLDLPYERSRQQDLSEFPIEKARLEIGLPMLYSSSTILLLWGWVLYLRVHVAVPCVLLFFFGLGIFGFNSTSNALVIDIHPGKAATATAANNFTRCLLGSASTAAILPIIDGMGVGWAFTLLGLLYILCSPALLAIMYWGIKWRKEAREKNRGS
ncbi:major facilitator superfamily transporter [Colletotrichum somersetense]|nr:major facilitator superfamily transporter [Colletotrichum somersetense]